MSANWAELLTRETIAQRDLQSGRGARKTALLGLVLIAEVLERNIIWCNSTSLSCTCQPPLPFGLCRCMTQQHTCLRDLNPRSSPLHLPVLRVLIPGQTCCRRGQTDHLSYPHEKITAFGVQHFEIRCLNDTISRSRSRCPNETPT
jgi:hypothetical protein